MNNRSNKQVLRERYQAIRASFSPEFVASASQYIIKNILRQFELENKYCAIYFPMGNEANITNLNGNILLPMIYNQEKVLKFAKWHGAREELAPSQFSHKILEPKTHEFAKPDIIFIPLVAADMFGNRLGYGKGHYDYTISQMTNVLKVGVGYSYQLCKRIDNDQYDQKLDFFVCERFIVKYY